MPRHKKTPTALSANYLACLKMECITNMEDFFETSKGEYKKASDFVRCLKIRDRIIAPLYRLPYLLSELSSALGLGSIVSTKSTNSELESGVIISLKRFFISFEESLAALIKSI